MGIACFEKRKGVAAFFAIVMLVMLIGFASLTVDVGALYNARADLQHAADAAALSGASVLASDAMLALRIRKISSSPDINSRVYERCAQVAVYNGSFGTTATIVDPSDQKMGKIDLGSATGDLDEASPTYRVNAVSVRAARSRRNVNGPLTLFFAGIFGHPTVDVSASATAALDDRFVGYRPLGATIIPITIHVDEFERQLSLMRDAFSYDGDSEQVSGSADGVPEVDIYPSKLASGNFALLNIGNNNSGTPNLARQIETGVTGEDLEREVGTPYLEFFDDDGNATSYPIPGNAGLKAALEKSIEKRIGDIVGIPIHSAVSGGGANAVYTVIGIRFVRVMEVSLKGNNKRMWVQPVTYTGPGLILDPNAPSSEGVAGQIVLVR